MKTQEVLNVFAKGTNFPIAEIANFPMTKITRPHLISIVEELEEITGKTLCNEAANQPLGWLDDKGVTFGDLAEYFAGHKRKVAAIRRGISVEELEKFKETIRKDYKELLTNAEDVTDDSVLSGHSFKHYVKDYVDAAYLIEEGNHLILPANLPLDDTSTLRDLIYLFVEVKFPLGN